MQPGRPPEVPVVAVGAVVVADDRLLMVRRGQSPAEGAWTLPGGRVERGERLEDAVVREVREETGIVVEVRGLLGVFEAIGDRHFVILDHLASAPSDAHPEPGDDAADARWVPLSEVPSLEVTPRLVETLRGWGVLVSDSVDPHGG